MIRFFTLRKYSDKFLYFYHRFNYFISRTLLTRVRVDTFDIVFETKSIKEYLWRARGSYNSEPITMMWLRTYVKASDILYDIGANVGAYSLYAGKSILEKDGQGLVYSFEPESQNYATLNRNIVVNKLSSIVIPFSIAISDHTEVTQFELSSLVPGSATHQLKVDDKPSINYCHKQGAFSLSLDEFVYHHKQPVPCHIKIDVDGLEDRIIHGMSRLLKDSIVQSILIEIELHQQADLIPLFLDKGFVILGKEYSGEGTENILFIRG